MTAMRYPVDGRDQREMSPNLRAAPISDIFAKLLAIEAWIVELFAPCEFESFVSL